MGRGARASLALLLAVLSATVASCGPKTIITGMWPRRYAVESSVDFIQPDGSVARQTLVVNCSIVDASDAIIPSIGATESGDAHWQANADGSILIVGDLSPCRWVQGPPVGTSAPAQPSWILATFTGVTSYRFDNATSPTRVEELSTVELLDPSHGLIRSAGMVVTRGEPTRTLASAFPALDGLKPSAGTLTQGTTSTLMEGYFNGVRARVEQLPEGVTCEKLPRDRPSVLHPGVCALPFTCTDAANEAPCSRVLGALPVVFDSRFGRAGAEDTEPDRLRLMTYFSSSVINAAKPPTTPSTLAGASPYWSPQLCYRGLCVKPGFGDGVRFYDPKAHRVITMSVEEAFFEREMFTDRKTRLPIPGDQRGGRSASR
jgi:hypothetical protein